MGLRSVMDGWPKTVLTKPVSPDFELPGLAVEDESHPIVFENVQGYPNVSAVTNVISSRDRIAAALGVQTDSVIDHMQRAMNDPQPVETVKPRNSAAFDHIDHEPVLENHLPIPIFYSDHERRYFASTIVVAKDPETDVQNLSFHRMMYEGENDLVMRMVHRHLHDIYSRTDGPLDVAVLMGVHPAIEIAAATSFGPDMSELELANALMNGRLTVTELNGLQVPAEAEIVFTARILQETRAEGPFVDLSRTWDTIRQQPAVEVTDLYMRPDPLVRIIVPGKREHAHLMGMPQEPRIYNIVENTVPTVQNVVLTPGGCSWLHCVVQIEKRTEGDPKNAGMAALAAHPSMKKVTIVDGDIDPADSDAVEWATATRMQPHNDIETIEGAKGSSLDPSQDYDRGVLTKWIVDATIPHDRDRSAFEAVDVQISDDVSLEEYQ